jgi:hypothetical protein
MSNRAPLIAGSGNGNGIGPAPEEAFGHAWDAADLTGVSAAR